jgi:hypothetical protein
LGKKQTIRAIHSCTVRFIPNGAKPLGILLPFLYLCAFKLRFLSPDACALGEKSMFGGGEMAHP